MGQFLSQIVLTAVVVHSVGQGLQKIRWDKSINQSINRWIDLNVEKNSRWKGTRFRMYLEKFSDTRFLKHDFQIHLVPIENECHYMFLMREHALAFVLAAIRGRMLLIAMAAAVARPAVIVLQQVATKVRSWQKEHISEQKVLQQSVSYRTQNENHVKIMTNAHMCAIVFKNIQQIPLNQNLKTSKHQKIKLKNKK